LNWGIPRGPTAALDAFHFRNPRTSALAGLNNAEWRETLNFTDRTQLTLPLLAIARDAMPHWVRQRADGAASRNIERLRKFEGLYRAIDGCLRGAGVEYLALKGLAHCPDFGTDAVTRVQYDLDLYVPRERAIDARDAAMVLGYEPIEAMERFPTDHLPTLIRKTGWEWRGDFFDPEIPIAVEIHFQFWNERLERLRAPGVEEFWERRVRREMAGVAIDSLNPVDALGFASLHLLKHVVQGSARPFHILEIARFLESQAGDDSFWSAWTGFHDPQLRRLQATMFLLAREWFGCETGPAVDEEIERLPAATRQWFDEFALSPARQIFHPAKDELWLHLSLVESRLDALAVARRRLLPLSLPGPVDAVHLPAGEMSTPRRLLRRARWLRHTIRRTAHHAAALLPAATSGARWWCKTNPIGAQFWNFLAAGALFNFAFFIYVLLFNLRLLDLGFREDALGFIGGASTLGCVAGTLPAASAVRRFGLRGALLGAIAGCAALAALRALATGRFELAALGFVGGAAFSGWAVVMTPTIAATVPEKSRAAAFGIFYSAMFAIGIAGNWIGGLLPGLVHGKQPALLVAAGLAALALVPASRLQAAAASPAPGESKVYPSARFLVRYMTPFALWNLATGSFNPFFSAYFARLGVGVERIGRISAMAQIAQIAAVSLAPLLFRRTGIARGVAWMMAATAAALACLAGQPFGAPAAAYILYTAFQWMSEPGLSALLMNNVAERERSGAAAVNYLVMFGAVALSQSAGGALVARYGYGPTLAGAAVLALVAAGGFDVLMGGSVRSWGLGLGVGGPPRFAREIVRSGSGEDKA
jgi:predicted MFS family arabinose efflux permease